MGIFIKQKRITRECIHNGIMMATENWGKLVQKKKGIGREKNRYIYISMYMSENIEPHIGTYIRRKESKRLASTK